MVTGHKGNKEQAVIQAIINADIAHEKYHASSPSFPPPVVTLSRDYGAGGRIVAAQLSERLHVDVFDREILDAIAEKSKVDSELMEQLDERVSADRTTAWIRSIFTTNTAFPESYRHHLINVILGICATGGIIIGRGAHVVLATRHVFRVRIVGGEQQCAERIAQQEHIDFDEAFAQVKRINKERDEYTWKMFHHRLDEAELFDLTVNTDKFQSFDAVTELIMQAMKHTGYLVHEIADS